jgi:lysyl-tRNA synthetase class 2
MTDSDAERGKLRELISSFPYSFKVTNHAGDITGGYASFEGKTVSIAGRAMAVRKAGKLVFIDIQDQSGRIQAYFDFKELGEESFNRVKSLSSGDIIGIKGKVFKTTPGQISVNVGSFEQLAKALRVLPDKWHGMQDVELRYRKRHLDLIMNQDVKEIFIKRARIISAIRRFMDSRGFIEVDTSIIHGIYGGAEAKPFKTHVNTLNEDHYMRIATELDLKRLIIGGLERVYEIGKIFRNEDADTTHNPEFTSMEWYWSYMDYEDNMRLEEELLESVAKEINGSTDVVYQGKKISFKRPFKRIRFADAIKEKTGKDVLKLGDEELFSMAEGLGIKFLKGKRNRMHAYDKIFETVMEPELVQPTFVLDFPKETTPLARPKRGNSALVERFDLYVNGKELGPAYSELNNPIIQRENFDAQEKLLKGGDDEVPPRDMDFVEAMEQGMPPTGGLGLGIDRLVMLLTNKASIKEVILFPMEKRGK